MNTQLPEKLLFLYDVNVCHYVCQMLHSVYSTPLKNINNIFMRIVAMMSFMVQ